MENRGGGRVFELDSGSHINVSDEPRRASVSSRADGSIALLGSPSGPRIGPTFHTFWCWGNVRQTRFTFMLADRRGDSVDVEAVGPADSLPELVQIFDD